MQIKAGKKLKITVVACNQDGTVQAMPIVDMQVIPRFAPVSPSTYDVTRYKLILTNEQGGTATVENPITIIQ